MTAATGRSAPASPGPAPARPGSGTAAARPAGSFSVAQSAAAASRPVQGLPPGQPEVPGRGVGDAAVAQDRQHERDDQGGRDGAASGASRRRPPAGRPAAGRTRSSPSCLTVADAPRIRPAATANARGDHRPPEQHGQPRHDQRLEPHVGHDRLFHLQLVGVQQHRRGGQRRQPAGDAAAQQHDVQSDGHGQAEQVLDRGDRAQVADQQDDFSSTRVPERVGAGRRAVQVLERVDVDQRGLVGELGQHPQHQPGGQQHGTSQ